MASTNDTNNWDCAGMKDALDEQSDPFRSRTPVLRPLLIALYTSVAALGTFGSLLVMAAVVRKPAMRTARNCFIINLAASDLLMCSVTAPFTAVLILDLNWTLGDTLCRITAMLQAISIFVSTFSIAAISLDRYLVILFPTERTAHRVCLTACFCFIWTTSIAVALPLSLYTSTSPTIEPSTKWGQRLTACELTAFVCSELWPSVWSKRAYTVACFLLQYFLPLLTLCFVYCRICVRLKKRQLFHTRSTRADKQLHARSQQRRATRLITMIVTVFAFAWFPLNVFLVHNAFEGEGNANFNVVAFAFCHVAGMLSAVANPMLYGLLNENFRKEFEEILCVKRWAAPICWHCSQHNSSADRNTTILKTATEFTMAPTCNDRLLGNDQPAKNL